MLLLLDVALRWHARRTFTQRAQQAADGEAGAISLSVTPNDNVYPLW